MMAVIVFVNAIIFDERYMQNGCYFLAIRV